MKNEYLKEIIDLSKISYEMDEVPVGAVVVLNGNIIGSGYNNKENSHLVTGHAEINAINEACAFLNDWRLDDCDLYVTLKPCLMCAGAILESRIRNVYYLCNKTNVQYNYNDKNYIKIEDVILQEEYVKLLQKFFENKRK